MSCRVATMVFALAWSYGCLILSWNASPFKSMINFLEGSFVRFCNLMCDVVVHNLQGLGKSISLPVLNVG